MNESTTINLNRCLQQLQDRDPAARNDLISFAKGRLKILADRMFFRSPNLHSRENADDLFQEAMLRLWQSLEAVGPTTIDEFMGLAALQIRRALNDLAREHFGRNRSRDAATFDSIDPENISLKSDSNAAMNGPEILMWWSEFHTAVDQLPEPDRTAFDLLYYHELTQPEAATLMQVSERQVRRYWLSARRQLCRLMDAPFVEM